MGIIRLIIFTVLCLVLFAACHLLWLIYDYQLSSEMQCSQTKNNFFIPKYSVEFFPSWRNLTFTNKQRGLNLAEWKQNGSKLLVDSKYSIEIGEDLKQIQDGLIKSVKRVPNSPTQSGKNSHFVVQYGNFQQIYSQKSESSVELSHCLTMPSVSAQFKLQHFVDSQDKLWLVSAPNNNVILLQRYDCQNGQMLQKIIHEPTARNSTQTLMINEIQDIFQNQQRELTIECLTYEADIYKASLALISESNKFQVISEKIDASHSEVRQNKIGLSIDGQSSQFSESLNLRFLDPTVSLLNEDFEKVFYQTLKTFATQVKPLLKTLNVETKWIFKMLNEKISQSTKAFSQKNEMQYLNYDFQAMNTRNDYILSLKYDHEDLSNSTAKGCSSLMRLDRYLLNVRTPVFHSDSNYDRFDLISVLKREKQTASTTFKRVELVEGYHKAYVEDHFLSLYPLQPSNQLHFMGVGEKLLSFYPKENINQKEYYHVRTTEGGVVLQGNSLKGAYEDRPLNRQQSMAEVQQILASEPQQVLATYFEAHIGYKMLYSQLRNNRVELINGMSGKVMLSHYINSKANCHYAGAYLFNNEWWIIEQNHNTNKAYLVKYELYVNKQSPKTINSVKRYYGEHEAAETDDKLKMILEDFTSSYRVSGYVILDIFRCIDEFYYIQFTDPKGKYYGAARIHFKLLSNRRQKSDGKYSGKLEQDLIVAQKDMIKETQKIDPYGIVIENANLLRHVEGLYKGHQIYRWKDSESFYSLDKISQFQILPYSVFGKPHKSQTDPENLVSEDIWVFNMRTLIENSKRIVSGSTLQSAKTKLLYIGGLLVFIIFMITLKILIGGFSQKVQEKVQGYSLVGEKTESTKDAVGEVKKGSKGKRKQKNS